MNWIMNYPTLLFSLMVVSSAMKIDHRASRRLSYSTRVIHDDPKHPNQPHASSSINFKFNTHSADASSLNAYHRQPTVHTTPTYHSDISNAHHFPYVPSTQSYLHSGDVLTYPQHQSFNVGYSMSFNNDKPKATKGEEIITGSRIEAVDRPNQHNQQIDDEFVRNSLIDSKKQKISGIKAKYPTISKVNVNTKQLLAQANLSPKTQKQLAYLDGNTKQIIDGRKVNSSPWQSLSPTVEIYHSRELGRLFPDGSSFDHSGKSETFDHYYKKTVPKLPLDTSLLRDPFLTTDKLTSKPSSRTIPIHFDTSLIQEMSKHYADASLETGASSSQLTVDPYHRPVALTAVNGKFGFKPPVDNPVAAQQFGFEAPKQMFSGAINNPPEAQRQVAYINHNGDFYNRKEADYLMSSEQRAISPSETPLYFANDHRDYFKNIQGVQDAFSGDLTKRYKDYVQTDDYDFQRELDKILLNNGEQRPQESSVNYKRPLVGTRDQFGASFDAKYRQKQALASSKKREKANELTLRQSRLNHKPRVVREYIDVDLRPPPLQENKAHRRVQTKNFYK